MTLVEATAIAITPPRPENTALEPQPEQPPPQQQQRREQKAGMLAVLEAGTTGGLRFEQEVDFPDGIFSYASGTDGRNGESNMWGIADGLRRRGIKTYNGMMVKAEQDWEVEWFGICAQAKFAIVILSDAYWQSGACVRELQAILKRNIPVYLLRDDADFKGRVPKGNFLGDDVDNIKLAGYFQMSKRLQKNCLPAPDKPLFHEQNEQNCDELYRLITNCATK